MFPLVSTECSICVRMGCAGWAWAHPYHPVLCPFPCFLVPPVSPCSAVSFPTHLHSFQLSPLPGRRLHHPGRPASVSMIGFLSIFQLSALQNTSRNTAGLASATSHCLTIVRANKSHNCDYCLSILAALPGDLFIHSRTEN